MGDAAVSGGATPVFVTTGARSLFVGGIAGSVLDYWMRHREAAPVVVLDWGADQRWWGSLAAWGYVPGRGEPFPGTGRLLRVPIPAATSQRDRHAAALTFARDLGAAWCVQTDDDILPRAECSLEAAVRLIESARTTRPAFGMPAGTPYGCVGIKLPKCHLPHILDGETPVVGPPIREAGAVGGLRFLSTTIDPARLPPYDPAMRGYDPLLCDAVRAQGLAVGVFWDAAPLGLRATHLRQEWSSVWPYHAIPDTLPRAGDGAHA